MRIACALILVGCAQPIDIVGTLDGGPGSDTGSSPLDLGVITQDAGQQDLAQDIGAIDLGAADLGTSDLGTLDAGQSPACLVDPFSACEDPAEDGNPNNTWSAAHAFHSTSVGCQQGDDFDGLAETERSILCHTEPADFYRLTVVACDTRVVIGELRLRPLTACAPELYELAVFHGGRRLDCGDAQFQMECRTEGEDKVALVQMQPGSTIYSWQFGIESAAPMEGDPLKLNYELSFTVR